MAALTFSGKSSTFGWMFNGGRSAVWIVGVLSVVTLGLTLRLTLAEAPSQALEQSDSIRGLIDRAEHTERSLNALKGQVARQRTASTIHVAFAPEAQNELPREKQEAKRAEPISPEAENQFFHAYYDKLEAFRTETGRDPEWSRKAESLIVNTAMSSPILGNPELKNVDCAATICRIESEHKSAGARGQFSQWLLSETRGEFGRITAHLPVGSLSATTYVAKTGSALPSHHDFGVTFAEAQRSTE